MAASSAPPAPRLPVGSNTASSTSISSLSSKKQKKTSTTARAVEEKVPTQSSSSVAVGDAKASQTTTAKKKKNKKKKHHSPFRIKVGCIVAVRYRPNGNHLKRVEGSGNTPASSFFSQVWTDPQAGRDDGLALIGRRIRCCFPKSVLEKNGVSTRILEGEVVSLVDYDTSSAAPRQDEYTSVELLVETKALETLPFLQQTNPQTVDMSSVSPTERKRQQFEDIIRGKDLVAVKANLAIGTVVDKETCSKHNIAKWVIRKRIPKPPQTVENGNASDSAEPPRKKKKKAKEQETATSLYVGDKHDSQSQQERNWRWLAGKYDDILLSSSNDGDVSPEELSCGMVAEVLKVEPTGATNGSSVPSTLAMVTLRRMILPEHTKSGRQSFHGAADIFDDADTPTSTTFQVPVEECVIISRKFERRLDTASNGDSTTGSGLACPIVTRAYSYRSDTYNRLVANGESSDDNCDVCHRCRKSEKVTMKLLKVSSNDEEVTCHDCEADVRKQSSVANGADLKCECRTCLTRDCQTRERVFKANAETASAGLNKNDDSDKSALRLARGAVRKMESADFDLPNNFLDFQSLPEPSEKPVTVSKPKRSRKTPKKAAQKASTVEKKEATTTSEEKTNGHTNDSAQGRLVSDVEHAPHEPPSSQAKEEKTFQPTCSRLEPYDPIRKRQISGSPRRQMRMDNDSSQDASNLPGDNDVKQSSRKRKRSREPDRVVETKSTSRAARADQRRLKRGVAALGASTSIGLDALAGREQQLRFDRSSIHAWGVFADEDINAGDMVVEYRGELIGNAMAEKREKEYENAKIGSDYMFRIDAFTVCDATKQGNVARFINASCDPNCQTKIINLNGNKRIVIYAKKDIKAGEELCYDYKFPFEHDESKRIPCHCGAKDCRGFMNWDKRYVSLTGASPSKGDGLANKQS